MARITGLEPSQTSFAMRFVFRQFRKLFGKELAPYKIQARVRAGQRSTRRVCSERTGADPACRRAVRRAGRSRDQLYAELRSHFSEDALIELAADIAQENYRARWNRVFEVDSDALYCPIPGSTER